MHKAFIPTSKGSHRNLSNPETTWQEKYENLKRFADNNNDKSCIADDSIAARFRSKHANVWDKYFREWMNSGIGGDRSENLLYRVEGGNIPRNCKTIVLIIGSNNIKRDPPDVVAESILQIAKAVRITTRTAKIFVCGILPRENDRTIKNIVDVNTTLRNTCPLNNVHYIPVPQILFSSYGRANLFERDAIHLNRHGYKIFGHHLKENIEACETTPRNYTQD